MDTATIQRCARCGQANRVPGLAEGKAAKCGKCGEILSVDGSSPLVTTDETFDATVEGPLPVIVDFWAPWCGPCRRIAPVLEDLARERQDLRVAKLNVDENRRTMTRFNVSGIPTLIFFRGGVEKGRIVGLVGKTQIEQAVGQYFA